jgi:hypothetical protein
LKTFALRDGPQHAADRALLLAQLLELRVSELCV